VTTFGGRFRSNNQQNGGETEDYGKKPFSEGGGNHRRPSWQRAERDLGLVWRYHEYRSVSRKNEGPVWVIIPETGFIHGEGISFRSARGNHPERGYYMKERGGDFLRRVN